MDKQPDHLAGPTAPKLTFGDLKRQVADRNELTYKAARDNPSPYEQLLAEKRRHRDSSR